METIAVRQRKFGRKIQSQHRRWTVDPAATLVDDLEQIAIQPYPVVVLDLSDQFFRPKIVPLQESPNPFKAHTELAVRVSLNRDPNAGVARQSDNEKRQAGNACVPQGQLQSDGQLLH